MVTVKYKKMCKQKLKIVLFLKRNYKVWNSNNEKRSLIRPVYLITL